MGKVYLVGAGPGDPRLITVKGKELLTQCEVLIYDRLGAAELLQYVKKDCILHYVGKQPGNHSKKQEEINDLLVACGKEYSTIVRLKGGDPFVFGRGGEEIEALQNHGIAYEVVPGISSAIAVPEGVGIPLTHRGLSRDFHVYTGQTNSHTGLPDYDFAQMAMLEGTLVFLMGLSHLGWICQQLMDNGKSPSTPVAVISNGSTQWEAVLRGVLSTIGTQVAETKEIVSPAVIVIGNTAACEYLDRNQKTTQHLVKLGVIATDSLWHKIQPILHPMGFQCIRLMNMKIQETEQMDLLGLELAHIEEYQWVVFTSQNGVSLFFQSILETHIDYRRCAGLRFAVLGTGTAKRLEEYGFSYDFIPTQYTIEDFSKEFTQMVKAECPDAKILIPRALQGNEELRLQLEKNGISFVELGIYDVIPEKTEHTHRVNEMDCLVFMSASGVRGLFEDLRIQGISMEEHVKMACIGGVTCEALREQEQACDIIATTSNTEGLIRAIGEFYGKGHKNETI